MLLSLDHQQRLNLIALIGAQRATVAEMRMLWRLQDRLELSEEEKTAIGYRVAEQQGMEVPSWNQAKRLPHREFEFSDGEVTRVKRALEEWPQFGVAERGWLEPLMSLFEIGTAEVQPAAKQ